MPIKLKCAYQPPSPEDGYRILVDRIWPRGVAKDNLRLDAWLKDVAPSAELRRWFDHAPEKWDRFKERYFQELEQEPEGLATLLKRAKTGRVTLIFGAKDEARNNAVALRAFLETRL
ncbi:MAG: DUF488 domain-containing protein [Alphaproteobacteria bacterium]